MMTGKSTLGFRLLKGSGRLGLARVALLAFGTALCVLGFIFAALLPSVFDSQRGHEAGRTAAVDQSQTTPAEALRVTPTQELYGSSTLRRLLVNGVTAQTPTPPGVARLPLPGHSVVSPALAAAIAGDADLASRLNTVVDGTIGPEGLVSPDELFAYTGISEAVGSPVVSFGVSTSAIWSNNDGATLAVELLILVGLPGLSLLVVSFRLSMESRLSRLRALRMVGLTASECARIFAAELSAAAVLGALLATVAYNPIQQALGASSLLGFAWFAEDASLMLLGGIAVVLATAALAYAVGFRASMRQLGTEELAAPKRQSTFAGVLQALLAAGAIASMASLVWLVVILPRDSQGIAPQVILTIYASTAVLTLAGLMLTTKLSMAASGKLANSTRLIPPTARLGFSLARHHRQGAFGSILVVSSLVLFSGLSSVFIAVLIELSEDPGGTVVVDVALRDLGAAERTALAELASEYSDLSYTSIPAFTDEVNAFGDSLASIYVGECASLALVLTASSDSCTTDHGGRLVYETELEGTGIDPVLEAGAGLTVPLADGSEVDLTAPQQTIASDVMTGYFAVLIPASAAPWASEAAEPTIHFRVSAGGSDYNALLTELTERAPNAAPLTQFKDIDSNTMYKHQRGVLQFGVFVGLILAIVALSITGLSQRMDQRRSIAALRILGLSARDLRVALAIQTAFPVLFAVLYFAVVALLAGAAFLLATNASPDHLGPTALKVLASAVFATAASMAVGAGALGWGATRTEDARE